MKELLLFLILTLMTTIGSSALLEAGSSATNTRNRRGAVPECGSPATSLLEITDKIAADRNPLKDLGGVAALFHNDEQKCGATLISRNYLLTAAHCVDFRGTIKVSLGQANIGSNSGKKYTIKTVHKYPGYGKSDNKYGDIALLETEKQVEYPDGTWPYCLPKKNLKLENNRLVRIAGWGLLNGGHTTSELKQSPINIKDKTDCEDLLDTYGRYNKYTQDYPNGMRNAILCAGGHGVDACKGDSGGPMFYKNPDGLFTVIGVISRGIDSCPEDASVPGFYTNVEHYLDWISEKTGLPSPSSRFNAVYSESGLWDAAKRGDMNYVNGATSNRIDINWKNPSHHHSIALHAAAEANKHQVVRVLLQKGANKDARDDRGMTPLFVASWFGAREAVDTLIENSANIDTPGNNGSTPLMVATWKGHYDIVKALLDANANTHSSNLHRETVLHNAAAYNRPEIAKLLLRKGVDTSSLDKWGLTAEELATEQGNDEVATIIRNDVAGPATRPFLFGFPG